MNFSRSPLLIHCCYENLLRMFYCLLLPTHAYSNSKIQLSFLSYLFCVSLQIQHMPEHRYPYVPRGVYPKKFPKIANFWHLAHNEIFQELIVTNPPQSPTNTCNLVYKPIFPAIGDLVCLTPLLTGQLYSTVPASHSAF